MAPTDKKTDRPIDEIKILSTEVFVDPYPDAEKALAAAREKVFQIFDACLGYLKFCSEMMLDDHLIILNPHAVGILYYK